MVTLRRIPSGFNFADKKSPVIAGRWQKRKDILKILRQLCGQGKQADGQTECLPESASGGIT
jgi:hypothetical protein